MSRSKASQDEKLRDFNSVGLHPVVSMYTLRTRRMNGLSITALTVLTLCCITWFLTRDIVSCVVSNSENSEVDGYYTAIGGVYVKRRLLSNSVPDVFSLLDFHRLIKILSMDEKTTTIGFSKMAWTINTNFKKKVLYSSNPSNPEKYLYTPPEGSWKVLGTDGALSDSTLTVHSCVGKLQDSPSIPSRGQKSNIEQLLAMPVTTSILCLIFYVAYYLYANRVEVSAVAYSFDAIANRGEYFKIISATLSHFDLMHLGFNTMALFQLGSALESSQYSSVVFLYSNVNLIFITILIETAILYVLIYRFNQSGLAESLSIGYSGVLFAWMVAVSVRMNKYCPIFLFPSFCVDTFHIPLPNLLSQDPSQLTFSVPVNLGPFALLLFTKLIIARSSFLGHLSGILIGYPLAWNLLNWLTPPVLVCMLASAYMWKEKLYLFDRNSSANHDELYSNLADFVNPHVLMYYRVFSLVGFLVIGLSILIVLANFNGYGPTAVRCVVGFLVIYAQLARKHSFTSYSNTSETNYVKIMYCTLVVILVVFLYDMTSLTAAYTSYNYLTGSGIPHHVVNTVLSLNIALCVVELSYIVLLLLNLYELPSALHYTSSLRLDKVSIEKDLERLGMKLLRGTPQAFSGTGHRLSGNSERANSSSGDSRGIALSPMPINTDANRR